MKPYVKQYENGILVNPITKERPYLHPANVHFLKSGKQKIKVWHIVRNKFFTGRTVAFW